MHLFGFAATLQVVISYYMVAGATETEQKFTDASVTPYVLPTAPNATCTITYGTETLELGATVNSSNTLTIPTVSYNGSTSDYFCLVFLAPDVPIDRNLTEYGGLNQTLLWGVVNIPGSNVTAGETIANYKAPIPCAEELPFTYAVYTQAGTLDTTSSSLSSLNSSRVHFNVTEFATNNSLTGPTFGFFMYFTYSEDIPSIMQQLYVDAGSVVGSE